MKVLLINDYGTSTGGAELLTISLRMMICAHSDMMRAYSPRPRDRTMLFRKLTIIALAR